MTLTVAPLLLTGVRTPLLRPFSGVRSLRKRECRSHIGNRGVGGLCLRSSTLLSEDSTENIWNIPITRRSNEMPEGVQLLVQLSIDQYTDLLDRARQAGYGNHHAGELLLIEWVTGRKAVTELVQLKRQPDVDEASAAG